MELRSKLLPQQRKRLSASNLKFTSADRWNSKWCYVPKRYDLPFLDHHLPSYMLRTVPLGSHARTMSVTTTVYPSSSTMATTDSRAVRFETECVLIPEPPAESLIRKLGKSFTLPLLKKSPEVEVDSRSRIIEERFGGRSTGHRWVYLNVLFCWQYLTEELNRVCLFRVFQAQNNFAFTCKGCLSISPLYSKARRPFVPRPIFTNIRIQSPTAPQTPGFSPDPAPS